MEFMEESLLFEFSSFVLSNLHSLAYAPTNTCDYVPNIVARGVKQATISS